MTILRNATTRPLPPVWFVDAVAGQDPGVLETGARLQEGFSVPPVPWDLGEVHLLCRGTVSDEASAGEAIAALSRGAGLVVHLTLTGADTVFIHG